MTKVLGTLTGQRLNLAKMHIANYCFELKKEAGVVDVNHVVGHINERFKLVDPSKTSALAQDVGRVVDCFANQQVVEMDRGSYWKWKAVSAVAAKESVERELKALLP